MELLGELGYVRLTIEATAARAQVGKTTIYRRWKSKGLLVVDLLADIIELGPMPDTGTTRGDLMAFLHVVVNNLRDPLVAQAIPGLANDLPTDEELSSAFRTRIVGPKLERVTTIMARAAERGEVPEDVDCVLVTDMLLGPVLWRSMLTEQPLNDEALGRIVDHVLTGIRRPPTAPASPRQSHEPAQPAAATPAPPSTGPDAGPSAGREPGPETDPRVNPKSTEPPEHPE